MSGRPAPTSSGTSGDLGRTVHAALHRREPLAQGAATETAGAGGGAVEFGACLVAAAEGQQRLRQADPGHRLHSRQVDVLCAGRGSGWAQHPQPALDVAFFVPGRQLQVLKQGLVLGHRGAVIAQGRQSCPQIQMSQRDAANLTGAAGQLQLGRRGGDLTGFRVVWLFVHPTTMAEDRPSRLRSGSRNGRVRSRSGVFAAGSEGEARRCRQCLLK